RPGANANGIDLGRFRVGKAIDRAMSDPNDLSCPALICACEHSGAQPLNSDQTTVRPDPRARREASQFGDRNIATADLRARGERGLGRAGSEERRTAERDRGSRPAARVAAAVTAAAATIAEIC